MSRTHTRGGRGERSEAVKREHISSPPQVRFFTPSSSRRASSSPFFSPRFLFSNKQGRPRAGLGQAFHAPAHEAISSWGREGHSPIPHPRPTGTGSSQHLVHAAPRTIPRHTSIALSISTPVVSLDGRLTASIAIQGPHVSLSRLAKHAAKVGQRRMQNPRSPGVMRARDVCVRQFEERTDGRGRHGRRRGDN